MRVRTKIENIEKKLGVSEEKEPLRSIIISRMGGFEWNEKLFKSKDTQDRFYEKIIKLEEAKIEKNRTRNELPVAIICFDPTNEGEVRKKIEEYKLDPAIYLK